MSLTEFHSRIAALDALRADPMRHSDHRLPRAETARERLDFAMLRLRRAGIYGRHAYWPVFWGLRAVGVIVPPLHFWRAWALFAFFLTMVSGVLYGLILGIHSFTRLPRMIGRLPEGSTEALVTTAIALALAATVVHVRQAREANLPRWRDL